MAPDSALLEQELREAREREAEYRTRLARQRGLSSKLRVFAATLREALKGPATRSGNVTRVLAHVARLSSQALGIPRTGIWLFDEARENLICRFRLPEGAGLPDGELRLAVASCPSYIAALGIGDAGAVAVGDCWRDPRTADLAEYLHEHHIGAMLAIPLVGPGGLHGVLCHEHQGGSRAWQDEEIDFATNVGAMVALALEADGRMFSKRTATWPDAIYKRVLDSLPVTAYSFHAKTGTLEYISPRVVELGGQGPEQYLVTGGIDRWVQSIEPEDREPVRKRLTGSIADGFPRELVYRIKLADGQHRWVRDTCVVVRDASGHPLAVHGIMADITSLKEAESGRAETEQRYRMLLEDVDLLVVMLDAAGHIEFVNRCFQRTTGFGKQELVGADGFGLILPPADRDRLRDEFVKGLRKGKIAFRLESNLRTAGGSNRRILWTNTVLRSLDGTVIGSASVGADITERLAAETSRREQNKLESLGRMAASVAHDFNNVLGALAAGTGLLERTPGDSAVFADMRTAITEGSELPKALLAYARREGIKPTLLSVDELVVATWPVLQNKVGPDDLKLTHNLGAPRARVVVDEGQLRQVLIHLISNAADATRGHGSEVRLSTNVVVVEPFAAKARGLIVEGPFVVVTVADDGRGMRPEQLARAFDPFYTTKERGHGRGLGLAMCASIVHRAGGYIVADSEPLRGTTFRVHLPAAKSGAPESWRPASATGGSGVKTVLLVVDSESIRNLVTSVLAGQGVEVIAAADVRRARAILAQRSVDVLLTDSTLPDGDAEELAREGLERRQIRRALLISGSALDGENHLFHAIIPKPFRVDAVIETVLGQLPPFWTGE